MIKPYNRPQNLFQKQIAFQRCINVLQELKQKAPDIFDQDPQVSGLLEQLQRDFDVFENYQKGINMELLLVQKKPACKTINFCLYCMRYSENFWHNYRERE